MHMQKRNKRAEELTTCPARTRDPRACRSGGLYSWEDIDDIVVDLRHLSMSAPVIVDLLARISIYKGI